MGTKPIDRPREASTSSNPTAERREHVVGAGHQCGRQRLQRCRDVLPGRPVGRRCAADRRPSPGSRLGLLPRPRSRRRCGPTRLRRWRPGRPRARVLEAPVVTRKPSGGRPLRRSCRRSRSLRLPQPRTRRGRSPTPRRSPGSERGQGGYRPAAPTRDISIVQVTITAGGGAGSRKPTRSSAGTDGPMKSTSNPRTRRTDVARCPGRTCHSPSAQVITALTAGDDFVEQGPDSRAAITQGTHDAECGVNPRT